MYMNFVNIVRNKIPSGLLNYLDLNATFSRLVYHVKAPHFVKMLPQFFNVGFPDCLSCLI